MSRRTRSPFGTPLTPHGREVSFGKERTTIPVLDDITGELWWNAVEPVIRSMGCGRFIPVPVAAQQGQGQGQQPTLTPWVDEKLEKEIRLQIIRVEAMEHGEEKKYDNDASGRAAKKKEEKRLADRKQEIRDLMISSAKSTYDSKEEMLSDKLTTLLESTVSSTIKNRLRLKNELSPNNKIKAPKEVLKFYLQTTKKKGGAYASKMRSEQNRTIQIMKDAGAPPYMLIEYVERMTVIFNELARFGEKQTNDTCCNLLISGLAERYDHTTDQYMNGANADVLELMGKLRQKGDMTTQTANNTPRRHDVAYVGKTVECFICKGPHYARDCDQKGQRQRFKKPGHYKGGHKTNYHQQGKYKPHHKKGPRNKYKNKHKKYNKHNKNRGRGRDDDDGPEIALLLWDPEEMENDDEQEEKKDSYGETESDSDKEERKGDSQHTVLEPTLPAHSRMVFSSRSCSKYSSSSSVVASSSLLQGSCTSSSSVGGLGLGGSGSNTGEGGNGPTSSSSISIDPDPLSEEDTDDGEREQAREEHSHSKVEYGPTPESCTRQPSTSPRREERINASKLHPTRAEAAERSADIDDKDSSYTVAERRGHNKRRPSMVNTSFPDMHQDSIKKGSESKTMGALSLGRTKDPSSLTQSPSPSRKSQPKPVIPRDARAFVDINQAPRGAPP